MQTQKQSHHSKIAVITGMSYLDVDRVIASIVLAKALARKNNTPADVNLGHPVSQNVMKKLINIASVNIVQNISLADRTMEISNIPTQIENIKWQQQNGKLILELYNANGNKIDPTAAALSPQSGSYSKVYTIGVRSAKYLLRLLNSTSEEDLKEVDLTSINVVNKREPGFEADRYINEQVHSFCAAVYGYCQANELDLKEQELTELLAGVYWKTNSFKNYYTTPATFQIANQILASGAKLKQAHARIYSQMNQATNKLWQELNKTAHVKQEITVSSSTKIQDYEKQLNNTILPIFTPLLFTQSKAAISALPLSDNSTLVIVSTLQPEINLHKLLADYHPKGDDLQVKIKINKPITQAIDELLDIIGEDSDNNSDKPGGDSDMSESPPSQSNKSENKPETFPTNSEPLSPANIDEVLSIADKKEEDTIDNSPKNSSMFNGLNSGGFTNGNTDPLPTAK